MQKTLLFSSIIVCALSLGYVAGSAHLLNKNKGSAKRVSGIGGIFFKCKDPKKLKEWYATHLGLNTDQYGTTFEWRRADDSTKKGYTAWCPFKESTTYFLPSQKDFMINYRVENMEALLGQLKNEGVEVCDTMTTYDYGKFVHIMDIEGNKIELWEPIDHIYEKGLKGKVTY